MDEPALERTDRLRRYRLEQEVEDFRQKLPARVCLCEWPELCSANPVFARRRAPRGLRWWGRNPAPQRHEATVQGLDIHAMRRRTKGSKACAQPAANAYDNCASTIC